MAGIRADHEERLKFYDKLSRERPLEEHELDRVEWLANRVKSLNRERKYRDNKREEIKKKQRDYLKTAKGKRKSARNFQAAYARNPQKYSEWGKKWRKENPEKYKAILDRKNRKRNAERRIKLMQELLAQMDAKIQEGFRNATGKFDWEYRDLPKMVESNFNKLIEIIGEENIHFITTAEYIHFKQKYKRGQVMISPKGLENIKDWLKELQNEV